MELFSDLISDLIVLVATQRVKQRQSTSLAIRTRFGGGGGGVVLCSLFRLL